MQFKQLLAFTALASLTQAFQIPEGQPDGTYTVSYDGDGNAIHDRVEPPVHWQSPPPPPPPPTNGTHLIRRADPIGIDKWGCFQSSVTSLDYVGAVNALNNLCANSPTYKSGEHAYAVSGGAVAFMCNYGGNNPCSPKEFNFVVNYLSRSDRCPNYRSGYGESTGWKKSYGIDSSLAKICGNV